MRRTAQLAVAAFAAATSLMGEARADQWSDAAEAIVRLPPSRFTNVPPAVVKILVEEGCLIPQASSFEKGRHNLIKGHFAARRQLDYAALCSKDGKTHIRIVWGGPVQCDSNIEEGRDVDYVQGIDDSIVFSRVIYPTTQRAIGSLLRENGSRKPSGLVHAGIEDAVMDKGSTVLYCTNGLWHWYKLSEAD